MSRKQRRKKESMESETNAIKELTLSDGRKAVIKAGKGRDLLNAQRKAKSSEEVMWSLLGELLEVDGKKIPFEDLLEMPLGDIMALMAELSDGFANLPFPQPGTSSISQKQPAGV
jgi:hypothetical protein